MDVRVPAQQCLGSEDLVQDVRCFLQRLSVERPAPAAQGPLEEVLLTADMHPGGWQNCA